MYLLACGVRAVLPRGDDLRTCIIDTPLSWPAVGRTLATFAEISFGFQCAVGVAALVNDKPLLRRLAYSASVLTTVAQGFCWVGVATQRTIYNAVEESLWAVAAAILTALCAFVLYRHYNYPNYALPARSWRFATLFRLSGLGYVAYMVVIDVPMYYNRHQEHMASGRPFYTFYDGVVDMADCKNITRSFEDWKEEMPWMTPYFTVATQASIFLTRYPEAPKAVKAAGKSE